MCNNVNDNFAFTFDVKLQEMILFFRVKFPYHVSYLT